MALRDDLKSAWNSLAYAYTGEMLPDEDKYRALGVDCPLTRDWLRPASDDRQRAAPRRQVAVSAGSGFSAALLDYAIGVCQRLEAGLVLLGSFGGADGERALAPWRSQLDAAGLPYRVESYGGDRMASVMRYVHRHSEVIFAVFAAEDLDQTARAAKQSRRLQQSLPVPMVVIAQGSPLNAAHAL